MKRKAKTLPKKIRNEIDFAYIEKLCEQEQRAATFYEYARHSDLIKELVREVRKEEVFNGKQASPKLLQKLVPIMGSSIPWMSLLFMLVHCDGFPDLSFRKTTKTPEVVESMGPAFGIGITTPCLIPWKAVDAFRADWKKKGLNDAEMLNQFGDNGSLHAIVIPWRNYTNDELTKLFAQVISRWRPGHFPEPPKRGRKGLSGTVDMLHQLSAYRLDANGYNRSEMRFHYTSEKGWKKAIATAKKRIEGMMNRPFFG